MATAEGNFTIPRATITANGNQMVSNSVHIKVLPADQGGTSSGSSNNNGQQGNASRASSGTSISIRICLLQLLRARQMYMNRRLF